MIYDVRISKRGLKIEQDKKGCDQPNSLLSFGRLPLPAADSFIVYTYLRINIANKSLQIHLYKSAQI
jgi:hypothetical protein